MSLSKEEDDTFNADEDDDNNDDNFFSINTLNHYTYIARLLMKAFR